MNMPEPKEEKPKKEKHGSFVKELMSGIIFSDVIILKNLWYIIFLTILGAFYIGNRFHAKGYARKHKDDIEVKDLKAEALSTSTSTLWRWQAVGGFKDDKRRGLGLEELRTPPYKIVIDK
jgi:hypothetical protein